MAPLFPPSMQDAEYKAPDRITRALILSLSVCYHARLQDREPYEDEVVRKFTGHILQLQGGARKFRNEIRWYGYED